MTHNILLEELRNIEKIIKQKTTSKCKYRNEGYKGWTLNQSGGSESVLGGNSFCPGPW